MTKHYCRFCGSIDLKDIWVNIKHTRKDEFKPEIIYQQVRAAVGSISKRLDSSTQKLHRKLPTTN